MQASYPTLVLDDFMKYRRIRRSQITEMCDFMEEKIDKSTDLVILAGDFNIDGREELKPPKFKEVECQDDYLYFVSELNKNKSEGAIDILREKYGFTPATFGRIDRFGNPIETVLSGKDDTMLDEGLDHIFFLNLNKCSDGLKVEIDFEETIVEPFFTPGQVFTQISDHAAVQTVFTWQKLSV